MALKHILSEQIHIEGANNNILENSDIFIVYFFLLALRLSSKYSVISARKKFSYHWSENLDITVLLKIIHCFSPF